MLTIYCDGGCLNNQTPDKREAFGSFTTFDSEVPAHLFNNYKFQFNNKTNNEAEYMSFEKALDHVLSMKKEKDVIEIRTDSQLIIGQLTQNWKINQKLFNLVSRIKRKLLFFPNIKIIKISGVEMKKILGH